MKIFHVIDTLNASRGGPPAVAVRLAAAQASMGHEVQILTTLREGDELLAAKSYQNVANIDKLKVHIMPIQDLRLYLLGSYRNKILSIIRGTDVMHFHGVWDSLLLATGRVARAEGIPYVLRPCGMLDPWSLSQHPFRKRLAMKLLHKKLWDRAAFLHVLNKDEADLIKPLQLKAPQKVIPNGVYESEVSPLPEKGKFRNKYPQLENRPFILFLSRLHYKKGLDILADAFEIVARRFPGIDLVVAGPDEGARTGFIDMIDKCDLQSRVHVVGPLYGSDKLAAMVDAQLFCLPSRQEGFSVAILEAMACGLPVVVTEECHFPEVGERGVGLVTALDHSKVADALIDLLARPNDALVMGSKARELVLTEYTWPHIATRTLKSYGEFC